MRSLYTQSFYNITAFANVDRLIEVLRGSIVEVKKVSVSSPADGVLRNVVLLPSLVSLTPLLSLRPVFHVRA